MRRFHLMIAMLILTAISTSAFAIGKPAGGKPSGGKPTSGKPTSGTAHPPAIHRGGHMVHHGRFVRPIPILAAGDYRVIYRSGNADAWQTYGYFNASAEASNAIDSLQNDGYEARIAD